MKLYEAVARSLGDSGVDVLFGLMGDANMRYIASYQDLGVGRYVGSVHEAGAVSMADGYARMSGKLGVVSITHGPGITNGLTALTEAARAHTPLLLITGETPAMREHLQWLDIRAAAHLCGAGYRDVQSPESALDDVAIAARLALSSRRPYIVNVPFDMLDREVDYKPSPFGSLEFIRQVIKPDADKLDAALGVMASSSRPIVLAGHGAELSGARESVIALANRLRAPVATTVMAKGFFTGHPLDLGIFGTESHSLAARCIQQSDCIIALGAGLNRYTTSNGELLAGKAVVHVDTDMHALARRHPATVSVLADVSAFVEEADAALAQHEVSDRNWADRVRADRERFSPETDFRDRATAGLVDMRTAMIALDEVLPEARTLVTDVGRFKSAPWRYLNNRPGLFTQTSSFGSIGLGLGAAIGAAFARPDDLTVAVVGDGGLMMGLLELSTAVQHDRRLVLVVLNDGSYGAEYTKLAEFGHDPEYSLNAWPSFTQIAQAVGADAQTVASVDDIRQLKATLENLRRPLLLDVVADPKIDVGKFD